MDAVFTQAALPQVAKKFWQSLNKAKIIALHGEMGAGKTTFVHALCAARGVTDVVSSPTFALINEYKTPEGQIICHMDWYRLKDEAEAIQAGVEDALYSGALCLVEWPEKALGLLPEDTVHVCLEVLDRETRRLFIVEEEEE